MYLEQTYQLRQKMVVIYKFFIHLFLGWLTDEKRLIVVAQNSLNKLGLGVDDLINAYVQAVLATVAIDKLANRFVSGGKFHKDIFSSL